MRITAIRAAEPGTTLWDDRVTGLHLRARASGAKAFYLYYRTKSGQQRRPKLGGWPSITLDQAREIASKMLAEVALGGDPGQAARKRRGAPTVADLIDAALKEHWGGTKSERQVRRRLNVDVRPMIGTLKVSDVTRDDVMRIRRAMEDRPSAWNRTRAMMSKAFNLAEQWGWRGQNSNPVRYVNAFAEKPRDRYLTPEELGRFLRALDAIAPRYPIAADHFRVLLLTGARENEIRSLQWGFIDAEAKLLRLPDSKTGPKVIRALDEVLAILDARPRHLRSPYVFWSPVKPMQPYSYPKKAMAALRAEAGIDDIRMHDLRHTFASIGRAAGLTLQDIGDLLTHSSLATTQGYAHMMNDPARAALGKVAAEMKRLIAAGEKG